MTHGAVDWYAARAAGVVAYVLLTAVVLVGVTLAGQLRMRTWPRFAVTDLHRFGSLLVGVFVGLHVLTIALDTYTPFSLTQLAVPFTSSYRPVWVALGIVSAELLIAVAVTNALRGRIPYRWWRRAHFATFLVWAGATVHGIGSGTDSSALWLAAIYVVAVASVCAALVWRIFARRVRPFPLGGLAAAAAVAGAAMTLAVGTLPHGGTARHVTAAVATVPAISHRQLHRRDHAAERLVRVPRLRDRNGHRLETRRRTHRSRHGGRADRRQLVAPGQRRRHRLGLHGNGGLDRRERLLRELLVPGQRLEERDGDMAARERSQRLRRRHPLLLTI